jgi:hypothetical protein
MMGRPGKRVEASPYPARAENTTAAGVTPNSINVLDFKRERKSAAFHASTKFCHWGCVGNVNPEGRVPCFWRAVVIMLSSGRTVNTIKMARIAIRVILVAVVSEVELIVRAVVAGSAR